MKIAALYDIHGNLPALEAVLDEIQRLDVAEIVVGGDVVLGPMASECIDKLCSIDIPVHYIKGNCEDFVLNAHAGLPLQNIPEKILKRIQWTASNLLPHQLQTISNWQDQFHLDLESLGKILFCHATPRNNTEIFTQLTPSDKLEEIFESVLVPTVVCGHTHMQFDIQIGNTRVVNSGSVGMPFGEPGAHWLLIGGTIEFRHTTYDYLKAAEVLKQSKYPDAEDFALNHVLNPPSKEDMLRKLTN